MEDEGEEDLPPPPLDWSVQDPNEYEAVPLPAHWEWIREVEELLNEMVGPSEVTNSHRQGNLERYLRWDQNTSLACKLCAYATFKMKYRANYTFAEAFFQRALEDNATYVPALCNYANLLYVRLHQHDEAEAMYKRALEVAPQHATVLNNYGLFLQQARKDEEAALGYFELAYKADPRHEVAPYHLGRLLKKLRNDTAAYTRLCKVASRNDPSKKWPKFRHGLLKRVHTDGCESLYRCPDRKCCCNIQNECHETRSCTKGHWTASGSRARFTEKEKRKKWRQNPKPLYEGIFRRNITTELSEVPGIQVPSHYYFGGRRPSRPLIYRGIPTVSAH